MADRKITDMTALAAGSQATDDLIAVVDVSEAAAVNKNKKMTMENLFKGIPGRIGIGTSSPADDIHINTATPGIILADTDEANSQTLITAAGRTCQIIATGASAHGQFTFSSRIFGNSVTERFRIDSSGNVGIGVAPAQKLDILTGTYRGFFDDGASNSGFRIRCVNAGNTATGPLQLGGDNVIFLSGPALGERARIDSSGRLLVGTSASSSYGTATGLLQILGTTNAHIALKRTTDNASQGAFTFAKSRGTVGSETIVNSGDSLGSIRFAGYDGGDYDTSAAEITAVVDGTPGADDMPGRLTFSTTADGASSPTERMRINSTGNIYSFSNQDQLLLRNANAAGTTRQFISGRHSATGATSGGTLAFQVFTNGNVENTNNSYGAISDIKLKENIVDASSQWDDLKALQVRNYNFKEGQTHTQIGLIAQEVELVSPGLVSESPDRDEEGNDLGTVTKSVNYSVLYMKAVKALQEAMARIETLEAKVAALEAG